MLYSHICEELRLELLQEPEVLYPRCVVPHAKGSVVDREPAELQPRLVGFSHDCRNPSLKPPRPPTHDESPQGAAWSSDTAVAAQPRRSPRLFGQPSGQPPKSDQPPPVRSATRRRRLQPASCDPRSSKRSRALAQLVEAQHHSNIVANQRAVEIGASLEDARPCEETIERRRPGGAGHDGLHDAIQAADRPVFGDVLPKVALKGDPKQPVPVMRWIDSLELLARPLHYPYQAVVPPNKREAVHSSTAAQGGCDTATVQYIDKAGVVFHAEQLA
jgi:hypothetical protein